MSSFCCPPDSLPSLVVDYKPVGTLKKYENIEFYAVGDPKNKAVIVVPDVWGFNGGRIRAIADLISKTGHYVVVPKLLTPCFEEGTDNDGLPNDFDMSSRGGDFFTWIKTFSWETSFKPKFVSLFNHLKNENCNSNQGTAMVGFCFGGWACAKVATTKEFPLIDRIIIPHPSVQLEEKAYGGNTVELCEKVKSRVLLLPAGNVDAAYLEGGDILNAFKKGNPWSGVDPKPYKAMSHGFCTRGDVKDDATQIAVKTCLDTITTALLSA